MDSQEKVPSGWIKIKSKTRPDRFYYYHKVKKISVWKISDCNDESKIVSAKNSQSKTPKKSPKKESKLSSHSIAVGKKNIADERLRKLQKSLKDEVKRGKIDANNKIKPGIESNIIKESVPKKLIENSKNSGIAKNNDSLIKTYEDTLKENSACNKNDTSQQEPLSDDESFKMEIDEQLDKSSDSLKDYEPMDWEDIDEKLVVQEVHNIRSKDNIEHKSFPAASQEGNRLSKDNFYIIVDTNVLLSNLQFVKEIKSKLFKDIGRAHIYLPYIVLCELDKLKMREENIARLARFAISYIDDCFKNKDEFLLGQSAIESSREIIEIDSGDDYIINCALQMKESTSKIILLSNDKNLRNKAFVNGLEAFSSDTLNYADYNVSNTIKFE